MRDDVACACGCGEFIPGKHLFRYREPFMLRGHSLPMPHCACGCGEELRKSVNARYNQPRFVNGAHARRLNLQPVECECGCGKMTGFWNGRPKRFISGHNSKGMKRGPGRYIHSRYGYVMLRMPSHPDAVKYGGYVLEHRYVMEQQIGRPLGPREHVHHLDHDRANNAIENLLIVNPLEHAKYHTSQPRVHQSEAHRAATAGAMKRVWAERKAAREG